MPTLPTFTQFEIDSMILEYTESYTPKGDKLLGTLKTQNFVLGGVSIMKDTDTDIAYFRMLLFPDLSSRLVAAVTLSVMKEVGFSITEIQAVYPDECPDVENIALRLFVLRSSIINTLINEMKRIA